MKRLTVWQCLMQRRVPSVTFQSLNAWDSVKHRRSPDVSLAPERRPLMKSLAHFLSWDRVTRKR